MSADADIPILVLKIFACLIGGVGGFAVAVIACHKAYKLLRGEDAVTLKGIDEKVDRIAERQERWQACSKRRHERGRKTIKELRERIAEVERTQRKGTP